MGTTASFRTPFYGRPQAPAVPVVPVPPRRAPKMRLPLPVTMLAGKAINGRWRQADSYPPPSVLPKPLHPVVAAQQPLPQGRAKSSHGMVVRAVLRPVPQHIATPLRPRPQQGRSTFGNAARLSVHNVSPKSIHPVVISRQTFPQGQATHGFPKNASLRPTAVAAFTTQDLRHVVYPPVTPKPKGNATFGKIQPTLKVLPPPPHTAHRTPAPPSPGRASFGRGPHAIFVNPPPRHVIYGATAPKPAGHASFGKHSWGTIVVPTPKQIVRYGSPAPRPAGKALHGKVPSPFPGFVHMPPRLVAYGAPAPKPKGSAAFGHAFRPGWTQQWLKPPGHVFRLTQPNPTPQGKAIFGRVRAAWSPTLHKRPTIVYGSGPPKPQGSFRHASATIPGAFSNVLPPHGHVSQLIQPNPTPKGKATFNRSHLAASYGVRRVRPFTVYGSPAPTPKGRATFGISRDPGSIIIVPRRRIAPWVPSYRSQGHARVGTNYPATMTPAALVTVTQDYNGTGAMQVMDQNRYPILNASIKAYMVPDFEANGYSGTVWATALTDQNGNWSLQLYAGNTWIITAQKTGYYGDGPEQPMGYVTT